MCWGFPGICWGSLGFAGIAGIGWVLLEVPGFPMRFPGVVQLGFVAISSKIYMKFVIILDLKETEFHKKRPTAQNGFNISPHMGQDSPKMVS